MVEISVLPRFSQPHPGELHLIQDTERFNVYSNWGIFFLVLIVIISLVVKELTPTIAALVFIDFSLFMAAAFHRKGTEMTSFKINMIILSYAVLLIVLGVLMKDGGGLQFIGIFFIGCLLVFRGSRFFRKKRPVEGEYVDRTKVRLFEKPKEVRVE